MVLCTRWVLRPEQYFHQGISSAKVGREGLLRSEGDGMLYTKQKYLHKACEYKDVRIEMGE